MSTSEADYGPVEKPHEERIGRCSIPAMDEILGKAFKVLDDGFVRVVDYLGGDESVVQAARVSYGKGTRKVNEDRGLVRYLLRHRHTTPLEMCDIKLHVRVPMDAWRQWIRHRTASVNEYSTRYSIAIDATQKTQPGKWRLQAKSNRQGSEGYADAALGDEMTRAETELHALARRTYDARLAKGIAREQARKDLPLATYTEAYWKTNLWNLLHFLGLRMETHAQEEIRVYAETIGREIVAKWVPIVWEAFLDYHFHAMHFSSREVEVLAHLLGGRLDAASGAAAAGGWLEWDKAKKAWKRNRERQEFEEKLKDRMGFDVKWPKPD